MIGNVEPNAPYFEGRGWADMKRTTADNVYMDKRGIARDKK